MVPHIVEHKHPGSYRLVVAIPCLDLLSDKFYDFKLVVVDDPFEPTEDDIRIQGIWEAKKRARINTLNDAVDATRKGWSYGVAEWYRKVIEKAGLGTELERAVLNWDIQVSYPHIYLPTYVLITPSILILRSLSISRETSYFFVSIVVTVMTPLLPSISLSETRASGSTLFAMAIQTYPSYWWWRTCPSVSKKDQSSRPLHYSGAFSNLPVVR